MKAPALPNLLLHPSGGLIWHWRALCNRRHWHPLQSALREWLSDWMCRLPENHRHLVLVGPSLGWTLPIDICDRFSSITIFEPDMLARCYWERRLPESKLQFDFHDIFQSDGLRYLSSRYSQHAILFCNVLGQLSPADPDDARAWCNHLCEQLQDRHWASYHDWISTSKAPAQSTLHRHFPAGTPLETALSSFWRETEIEIIDHNTEALAYTRDFCCIPWRLRKNQWHLIQWVSQIAG